MKKNLIILLILSSVCLFFIHNKKSEIKTSSVYFVESKIEKELFLLANSERANRMEWNNCLAEIGRLKAIDMYKRNYFSHYDPETNKIETWENIENRCFVFTFAGENLVMNFKNSQQAHKALMESPTHRENIVENNFSKMGVGCYKDRCVEVFTD
jgi:uncharacterized protein YkwD